jgi:hypothetical protein
MPYAKNINIKDLVRDREKMQAELARYRTKATTSLFQIEKLKNEIERLNTLLKRAGTDNRHDRRIEVSLVAELKLSNKSYSGLVDNLSEEGLHLRITPTKKPPVFQPDKSIELKLKVAPGIILNLPCMEKWSCDTPPHCTVKSIGLQIQDPPVEYKNFLKTLP